MSEPDLVSGPSMRSRPQLPKVRVVDPPVATVPLLVVHTTNPVLVGSRRVVFAQEQDSIVRSIGLLDQLDVTGTRPSRAPYEVARPNVHERSFLAFQEPLRVAQVR